MSQYSTVEENVQALLKDFTHVGRSPRGNYRYLDKNQVPHFFGIDPDAGDMVAVPESEYGQWMQRAQEARWSYLDRHD